MTQSELKQTRLNDVKDYYQKKNTEQQCNKQKIEKN